MWEYNYTIPSDELMHFGVPGMKWGHRKAAPIPIGRSRTSYAMSGNRRNRPAANIRTSSKSNQDYKNSPEHQAKVAKAKKAAKVGAVVVGTALAAYGTYKLAKYAQDKRSQAAAAKAQKYINENFLKKDGYATFKDGSVQYHFSNQKGASVFSKQGMRNSVAKEIGKQNAKTVSIGKQMYKDAMDTKLDRGLSKVVNAGDAVGNAAKRAGTSVGNQAKRAGDAAKRAGTSVGNQAKRAGSAVRNTKNRVLDKVNPLYEYVPGETRTEIVRNTGPHGANIVMNKTYQTMKKVQKKRT